jgi:hypothetical protein
MRLKLFVLLILEELMTSLFKLSFHSDNYQTHQYTILNLWYRPRHMALVIQDLTWDRPNNVAGLNQLMGSQPSHLHNWISNGSTFNKHMIK